MKIVVIGGTGLIGSRLVNRLQQVGHEAVAASPSAGVNTLTGEGLSQVLEGASVVVDVANSASIEGTAAMGFFENSTRNLLAAESAAGVKHHVALSVVGTERLSESPYFRAKIVQEYLVMRSGIPWSIVHATQFFEFLGNIVDTAANDANQIRLAPVAFRPMAADDVARAVARVAAGTPLSRVVETAGPEEFRMDELARAMLRERGDARAVITDPDARYYGALVRDRTLLPGDDATRGELRLDEWLADLDSLTGKPPRQEFIFQH